MNAMDWERLADNDAEEFCRKLRREREKAISRWLKVQRLLVAGQR